MCYGMYDGYILVCDGCDAKFRLERARGAAVRPRPQMKTPLPAGARGGQTATPTSQETGRADSRATAVGMFNHHLEPVLHVDWRGLSSTSGLDCCDQTRFSEA